jgi:hypothetical protein
MVGRLLLGLLVAGLLPSVCAAQEKVQYLTWVRYFRTQPGQERDFVATIKEVNGDTLDGLVKQGKLRAWGIAIPFTRTEEPWTHAVWLSVPDWAHMDEVVQGFEAAEQARGKEANEAIAQRFRGLVEAGSVHDEVFRNIVVSSAGQGSPSAQPPAYIRLSAYKVRAGHQKDAVDLYKRYALPVYESLIADGSIIQSGLAVREIVSDSEWTHLSWMMTANLAALDKAQQAFAKAEEARSPQEQADLAKNLGEALDFDAYRSQILRIVHLGVPAVTDEPASAPR